MRKRWLSPLPSGGYKRQRTCYSNSQKEAEGRHPPGLGAKAQVGRTCTPIGPTQVLDRNLGFPSLAWTLRCHDTGAHRTSQNTFQGGLASEMEGLAFPVLRED